MKKNIILIAMILGLFACSKKNNDVEQIPILGGPKFKTSEFKGLVSTFTYDSYGRQVKQANSDGSSTETSYTKTKVAQKIFDKNGIFWRTITITLNQQGLQSRVEYSDKPGEYTDYEYNSKRYLLKTYGKNGADINVSQNYYSNGNLDSTRYFRNGVLTLTNVYTYYPDKTNVLLSSTNGIPFYGTDKKNMMKSLTHVNVNGTITPEEYSYDFDAMGRVTTLKEVSPNGPSAVNYTYY